MSVAPRLIACPTCRGEFPASGDLISVCPQCGERVLSPAPDGEEIVDLPAADAPQTASIRIECKLCSSRYYARPSQVGQMLKCPDCHTFNRVPDPAESRSKRETERPPPSDDDDFKLSDPVDTPQYRALTRDAAQFEQALRSREGLKPPAAPLSPAAAAVDSGFELLDEPPSPAASPAQKPAAPAAAESGFELLDEPAVRQESAASAAPVESRPAPPPAPAPARPVEPADPHDIDLFPEDRLPPAAVARPQPTAAPREEAPADLDDIDAPPGEVRLSQPVERVEQRPFFQLPKPDPIKDDDDGSDFGASMRKFMAQAPAPELPAELAARRPFSTGLFSFLLQLPVLSRWIFLAMMVAIDLWIARYAYWALSNSEGGLAAAGAMISTLFLLLCALLPGIAAVVITASSLAIVEDTANGQDQIESWGDFFSFQWIGGAWYLLAATFVSGMPAALLVVVLEAVGIPRLLMALLIYPSVFLLFPPVLLSMLEEDTVASPLTRNMLRSFMPLLRFWIVFYLISLGMGFVGIMALFFAFWLTPVSEVISAAVVTAIPFIYFRLLGRMAMMYRDYVLAITPGEEELEVKPRHAL